MEATHRFKQGIVEVHILGFILCKNLTILISSLFNNDYNMQLTILCIDSFSCQPIFTMSAQEQNLHELTSGEYSKFKDTFPLVSTTYMISIYRMYKAK